MVCVCTCYIASFSKPYMLKSSHESKLIISAALSATVYTMYIILGARIREEMLASHTHTHTSLLGSFKGPSVHYIFKFASLVSSLSRSMELKSIMLYLCYIVSLLNRPSPCCVTASFQSVHPQDPSITTRFLSQGTTCARPHLQHC